MLVQCISLPRSAVQCKEHFNHGSCFTTMFDINMSCYLAANVCVCVYICVHMYIQKLLVVHDKTETVQMNNP